MRFRNAATVHNAPDGSATSPRGANRDNGLRRLAAGIVVLAIILYWAAALYGIRSPFYYGHYGYHGGSHATWARGTLRHHTLLHIANAVVLADQDGLITIRGDGYRLHVETATSLAAGSSNSPAARTDRP